MASHKTPMVLSAGPQQRLELGAGILDRLEVRAVGRQVQESAAELLDGIAHAHRLAGRPVVHDHDVTGLERGGPHPLDARTCST